MNSSALPPKLASFLKDFELIEDIDERSDLLIELAKRFREVPPEVAKRPFDKTHLVPGCESEAYLWAKTQPDGGIKYYFAVENPQGISAKAMAVILNENVSGAKADEIGSLPEDIAYRIFGTGLSMGKGLGLTSMIRMAKQLSSKA